MQVRVKSTWTERPGVCFEADDKTARRIGPTKITLGLYLALTKRNGRLPSPQKVER